MTVTQVGAQCEWVDEVCGVEKIVRYVVRLREVMELVWRCSFNARLGIVNRINKVGCTQGTVTSFACTAEHVDVGLLGKSRKESDETKKHSQAAG